MKRILYGVIAVVIVGAGIFYACKKNKDCQNCEPRTPDATEQIVFNLANKTFQSKFDIINCNYGNETVYQVNEDMLQFFIEYCISKNIESDKQAIAFVLYYDTLVSQTLSVVEDNIKGISVYTIDGYKITHSLYIRDENDNFYEEKNVRVYVPGITANHFVFYARNYVFTDYQNKSDILLMGNVQQNVVKNLEKYWSPMKYEIKYRKLPR